MEERKVSERGSPMRRRKGATSCATLIAALAFVSAGSFTGTARGEPQPPPTPNAPAPYAQEIPTGTPEGLAEYLTFAFGKMDEYWKNHFKQQEELTGPSAYYSLILPGQESVSRCLPEPIQANTQNYFYCAADSWTNAKGTTYTGGIHMPVGSAMDLRAETSAFAVATVMAHEYGHEVTQEYMTQLNLPGIVQMKDGAPVLDENGNIIPVKEAELIADCFSGNWAKYAFKQKMVRNADLGQAVRALVSAADTTIGAHQPHGNKSERTTAFTMGYNTGSPLKCAQQYWVTHPWP
ncbi:neutral zinc metallopeptidase [Streptomyces sp. NPDC059985]|uniref:neutral zinc metallopeptidase n=1 Tax=Streptomyces sp. NPDC059985 TaxID=3347025 RepID=UPI0036A64C60